MPQKIVLIGAGSANFGLGTLGDLLNRPFLNGSEICLVDINPVALKRNYDFGTNYITAHNLPFTLTATTDRKEALQGATVCYISIEVGNRFDLWDQDWMIPLQYGIRQVYGENGGPGGLFHSLRIIPPILEICEDIMRICPDAWVFNFSNPMSRICTAVTRKFPEIKLIGLCHEAYSLPEHLPLILNTPDENLVYRAGGLNHFSILLDVRYKNSGEDAYPDVRRYAPAYFAAMTNNLEWATENAPAELAQSINHRQWAERGLFQVMLEKFGFLPITTDSHFGEYIHWAYEVSDLQGIMDFYRAYVYWVSQQVNEERLLDGKGEGWGTMSILEGLLTNSPYEEIAVNIPNHGFIDILPEDIVVEVPAIVDGNGVHGIKLGSYPRFFGALLNNQYGVHYFTAEAAITGSRLAALQALLVDPLVHSVRAAEDTLNTMIKVQHRWLGYLK